ncbi:MAG: hypothetical protein JWO63_2716 [Frankiales bacterium]|jgi:uncharacterized protein (DUF305 family)|nr:hypothetical protein [Frankiales bacterium]
MTATLNETDELEPADGDQPTGGLRRVLVVVIALALLVGVGGAGYLIGHRDNGASLPTADSVDAGFAWDMSVHHRQAVTMAGFVRDHTTDPSIEILAYDIESSQNNQVGQMQGWLDGWGLPANNPNPQMAWMAGSPHDHVETDGLMPGMATPAEMNQLESLSGKALDIDFLQLMLRHHQGGLPMVQWAAEHASTAYVRNAAQKMADSQSNEIILMEQMLRERGASPLAPPD